MSALKESFDKLMEEFGVEMEKQRALHSSAFGKENAIEITKQAEENRKRLEGWREHLHLLQNEMLTSELFDMPIERSYRSALKSIPTEATRMRGTIMTGKKPSKIIIFGKSCPVTLWSEMLIKVTQALCEKNVHHADTLIESTELNRYRRNFSRQGQDIRIRPRHVPGFSLYVETNKNARNIFDLCYKLLKICGYEIGDLKIVVEK